MAGEGPCAKCTSAQSWGRSSGDIVSLKHRHSGYSNILEPKGAPWATCRLKSECESDLCYNGAVHGLR
ncbi:hypothetical protein VZT92_004457 [Zoarces viviparus]|uniref:Uncharacterized protein n=1 Tax=Zoarces viviparus TaxID=48416 RepID=A0AAW1FWT5_ZOAVI